MPQEIYNEGRVVGLSAWEIFKREAEANGVDPQSIPTEREWLASMIGSGASMILRIKAGKSGVQDFPLPSDSKLTAAGVIVASPFIGECVLDSDDDTAWAKRITTYNRALIGNGPLYPPSADNVPVDPTVTPEQYAAGVAEFVKITDGIVYLKNANWIPSGDLYPADDIDPNLGRSDDSPGSTAVVRLYISSQLTSDVYVLLTGFHNRAVIQALSGWASKVGGRAVGGSNDMDHNDWASGGMLGPEIFPWASKIIFSVPSAAAENSGTINRSIPQYVTTNATVIDGFNLENLQKHSVKSAPIVDFDSIQFVDYFRENGLTSSYTLSEGVFSFSKGNADNACPIVAWYPGIDVSDIGDSSTATGDDFFPPALYVASVSSINPTPVGHTFYVHTTSGDLNARAQPNTAANITATIPNHTVFTSYTIVTGETVGGIDTWVYYDGTYGAGYVSGKYLDPTPTTEAQDPKTLYPIDVAAPGTVKYFTSQTKASKYVTRLPASCAIYHNTSTNSLSFAYYDSSTSTVNWASPVSMSYDSNLPKLNISSGDISAGVLALTDSSGDAYPVSGANGSIPIGPSDKLAWDDLLNALKYNRNLDILGYRLRAAGQELEKSHSESDTTHSTFGMVSDNKIDYVGTRWIMLNPGDSDADPAWADSVDPVTNLPNSVWIGVATYTDDPAGVRYLALNSGETPGTSIALGTQFMRFGNGLKFYISNTAPSTEGVPLGSIGIGW